MTILIINCGSSSLKYQLICMPDEKCIARGMIERIGTAESLLTHKVQGKENLLVRERIGNHKEAMECMLRLLTDPSQELLASMNDIDAVGHRVVHGGDYFSSVIIDDLVIQTIEGCNVLAPLHNPSNITGIRLCMEILSDTPMVAVFDTAFHQTMPEYAFVYPIPYELYKEHRIRKYGFHGTSHKFVANEVAKIMGKDINNLNAVSCHLGNGSSICAIKNGKSIDTSMGFTPLAGVAMGTRAGSIDPAITTFLMEELNLSAKNVIDLLNKESGILGISGINSDFRDVLEASVKNERAKLAIDIFTYEVRSFICSYFGILGGADCIIFTAGVGENAPLIRAACCKGLEFLGVEIDITKNNVVGKVAEISTDRSKVKVFVVPTNEELMIAREVIDLVANIDIRL